MVDKEIAITRLQNTLLRLPKDDLVKLLKSTYQAMRIKHGIPYERTQSNNIVTSGSKASKDKGSKASSLSRSKTKSTAARKKHAEVTQDTQDDGRLEHPTFRMIDPLVDDFKDLGLYTSSHESDRAFQAEQSEAANDAFNQRSVTSPTQCVMRHISNDGHMFSDHDLAADTLGGTQKHFTAVPPLDLSRMEGQDRDAYRAREAVTANRTVAQRPNGAATVARMGSSPIGARSGLGFLEQRLLSPQQGYDYRNPPRTQPQPRRMGCQGAYNGTVRQVPCVAGYNPAVYGLNQPQIYQPQPTRAVYQNQVPYRDSYQMRTPGPFQVRGRSVHRP